MSDAGEKLVEFKRAWMDADTSYVGDIQKAGNDPSLVQEIDANWWRHQANWSMAATAALEKNSTEIQDLLRDAKQANDSIKAGRARAEEIGALVRKSSTAADALSKLLKAVAS
ncbi:MAG: hypothetical protein EBR82_16520 [Caulobacteraceae bacterium]|nr:hypothetical protein [Caulobacteraceae bacterium]